MDERRRKIGDWMNESSKGEEYGGREEEEEEEAKEREEKKRRESWGEVEPPEKGRCAFVSVLRRSVILSPIFRGKPVTDRNTNTHHHDFIRLIYFIILLL